MANYRMFSDIMETVPENNEGQEVFSDPKKNLLDEFAKSSDGELGSEHMKVYLRIRPLTTEEVRRKENQNVVHVENNHVLTNAPVDSHTYKNSTHGTAKSSHRFTFSKIFKEDVSQKQFFEETMLQSVKDFIDGQNCLVFTYGVTSSGKTYTVQGNPKDAGVLPRALDVLFNSIEGKQWPSCSLKPKMFTGVVKLTPEQEIAEQLLKEKILKMSSEDDTNMMMSMMGNESTDTSQVNNTTTGSESSNFSYLSTGTKESVGSVDDLFTDIENRVREEAAVNVEEQGNIKFSVWVSFAEIYNEQIFDLLEKIPSSKKKKVKRNCLKLSEDRNGSPYIRGLKEVNVTNGDEAYRLLKIGQKNLRTACTRLNHSSSRSHCIFTIKVLRVVDCASPHVARVSMLSLCDLAGSERQSKTHTMGERVKEAGNINTSLLTLGRCVETLRYNQCHKDHQKIVPFRDSKLTRLFQNFFSGRGKAAMVININPCASMFDETLCVLKFSAIAKQVVVPKHEPKPLSIESASENDVARNSIDWESSDKVAEVAAVPLPGDDDDDLETSDSEIAELLDIIDALRNKIKVERREKALLEAKIRDKVCQEMMEQIVKIEQENCERVREREMYAEERAEQRIALLMESMKKQRKRRRTIQTDDDEFSSHLLESERSKVKERDQTIAELRADVAGLKIQLRTLTEDREKNICEISTLQFQIAETKCNAEAEENTKPDGDIGNSVLIENLSKQLEQFRRKVKELEVENKELTQENKELTQSLNEAGETFHQKEEKIETLESEVEKLKSQLSQYDERNHYQERLIEELKVAIESSKSAVDDADIRLSVKQEKLEELLEDRNNLQVRVEEMENEKNSLLSEKDEKLEEYQRRLMVLESMESDIHLLEERLLSMNEKEERIHQQEILLSQKEKEIAELKSCKDAKHSSSDDSLFQKQNEKTECLNEKITELESTIKEKSDLNCGLMSDLTQSQKTIKLMEDNSSEKEKEIVELNEKIKIHKTTIEDIQNSIIQKDSKIENLKLELEKNQEKFAAVEESCKEEERLKKKYEQLEKDNLHSFNEKEIIIENLKSKYDKFELLQTTTLQEKDKEIEKLSLKIKELEGSASKMAKESNDKINELNEKLNVDCVITDGKESKKVAELTNKVKELENEKFKALETSKKEISELNNKHQNIQTTNCEVKHNLEKEIEILKTKLNREEEESFKREQALIHGYKLEIENLMAQIHKLKCQLRASEQENEQASSPLRSPRKNFRHLGNNKANSIECRSPKRVCLSPLSSQSGSPVSSPKKAKNLLQAVTSPLTSLQSSVFSDSVTGASEDSEVFKLRKEIKQLKDDLDLLNEKNFKIEKELEVSKLAIIDMQSCLTKEREQHTKMISQIYRLENLLLNNEDTNETNSHLPQTIMDNGREIENERIDSLFCKISYLKNSEKELKENQKVLDQKIESLTNEVTLNNLHPVNEKPVSKGNESESSQTAENSLASKPVNQLLCPKCEDKCDELKTLREMFDKTECKRKELKAQYESQVEDNESLLEQFERLQNELEELKALENSPDEKGIKECLDDTLPLEIAESSGNHTDQQTECRMQIEELKIENQALSSTIISLEKNNTESCHKLEKFPESTANFEVISKKNDELRIQIANMEQVNNELMSIGEQVSPLKKQLEHLTSSNEELNVMVVTLKESNENSIKLIKEHTTMKSNLEKEKLNLENELEIMKAENIKKEDELCSLKASLDKMIVEKEKILRDLNEKKNECFIVKENSQLVSSTNKTLEENISSLPEVNKQLNEANCKYNNLEMKYTDLSLDYNKSKEMISSMEGRIEDYENELSELKYSLSVKNDVVTSFQEELSRLNEIKMQLEDEKHNNEKLKEKVDFLLNEKTQYEGNNNRIIDSLKDDIRDFNELKSNFVLLKVKYEDQEKERMSLLSDVESLKSKNEETEKCVKEKLNLEESLRNDVDALQKAISELTEAKEEALETLRKEMLCLIVEKQCLEKHLEEKEKEKVALVSDVSIIKTQNEEYEMCLKEKSNLEESLKNDVGALQKLINELTEAKEEVVETARKETQCLIIEKQCLEKQLEEKGNELESLQKNFEHIDIESIQSEHNNSIANLNEEINVLSKAKYELEKFVKDKNSEIEILTKSKNSEIHNLQCVAEERSSLVISLKEEVSKLNSDMNDKNIKMQNLQESYKDLKAMIFDQQFCKDVKENAEGSSEAIENLVFERKRNRELQALVKRLEESDPVAAQIPGYNRKLRKEKIEAENALINARFELDCLKKKLENSNCDKQETSRTQKIADETLNEELARSQERERKLRSQLQDACKNTQELNKKIDDLEEKNHEKTSKLHETEHKLSDLQNQMGQSDIAKQEWNKLEEKLKEANTEITRKSRKNDLLKEKLISERDKFEIALKDAKANEQLIETLKDAIREQEETMTCQDQVLNDKTEEIKTLHNELEKITDKYHQMIQNTDTSGREMRDLVRTQARLESDKSQLQQQLMESNNNLSKLENLVSDLKKSERDCQLLQSKLEDAHETYKQSEMEKEQLEFQLKTQEFSLKKLQENFENLKCDKIAVEKLMQDTQESQQNSKMEKDEHEKRILTQESTIEKLQGTVEKFRNDKESLQNKLQDAYEKQHSSATEIEQLKKQINTQEFTVKRLEELVEKYSGLELEKEDLEKKISEQNKVIDCQEKVDLDKEKLVEKYSFLEIEKDNLEKLVVEKERLLKSHEQDQESREELKEKFRKKEQEWGQMVGKCANLEAEKKVLDQLIVEKEHRIQDIVEKCAFLEQENKKTLEKRLSENEQTTDKQNQLEKDFKQIAEKYSLLQVEKINLEKLTVDQDQIINRLEDVIKKLNHNKQSCDEQNAGSVDTNKLELENKSLKSAIDDSNREIRELEKLLTDTRQELENIKVKHEDIIEEKVDHIKKELSDMIQELKVKVREKDHKFRESDREHRKAEASLKKALHDLKIKDEQVETLNHSQISNEEQMKKWKKEKDDLVASLESIMKKQMEEIKQLKEERLQMVGSFNENNGKKSRQSAGGRKRTSSDPSDQVSASRSRRRKPSLSEEVEENVTHEVAPLMMTIKEEPIDEEEHVDQKPPLRSSSRKCKKIAQDKIKDLANSPKPASGRSLRCSKKAESQV